MRDTPHTEAIMSVRKDPTSFPPKRGGWTIPKASLVCELDVHRSISPACTKYEPKWSDKHSSSALMIPRREMPQKTILSDPCQINPKPLPQPKGYFSTLPKDKGGFLSKKTEGADFMIRRPGIGETKTRGGIIPQVSRFSPIPGAGTPEPSLNANFSVMDLRPSQCRGAVISKTPLPRGGGTKLRPSRGDGHSISAFERCSIPDVSFAAARFATRSILMNGDDYETVDDPKLKADLAFLKGVREDIARWQLKSALH